MSDSPLDDVYSGESRSVDAVLDTQSPIDRSARALEQFFRKEWGSVLSILMAHLRDLQLAEDVLSEAMVSALETWKDKGVPGNPKAWLLHAARNRAVDRIRRASNFRIKKEEWARLQALDTDYDSLTEDADIPDERLRLIFTCCHDVLERDVQIALTLRTLCGLNTSDIARAFLLPEATLAQRLVRAKRKIQKQGVAYEVPELSALPERLESVLAVVYLIFNKGYSIPSVRGESNEEGEDLCAEAMGLGRALLSLLPDEPEVAGLNALMYLHDARRAARHDQAGELIMLDLQDRTLWNRERIASGQKLLARAMQGGRVGIYTLQGAISAEHATAPSSSDTNWRAITVLYGHLYSLSPSPVIRLNRAVSLSFAQTPDRGLEAMPTADDGNRLDDYQPYHAALADMQARAGRPDIAEHHYQRAIDLSQTDGEKRYLRQKKDDLNR